MTGPNPVEPTRPALKIRARKRIGQFLNRPVAQRLWTAWEKRRPDVEVRQLAGLRAEYAGADGADVLLFGDSAMFWTRAGETDSRDVTEMLRNELGGVARVHEIVGPGYNARIVMAFLTALRTTASRPRVVVIPASLMMAMQAWLDNPKLSYEVESAALRRMVEKDDRTTRRMPRPSEEVWNAYDRQPAVSLSGGRRTYGELRMVVNAVPAAPAGLPTTKWQHFVRVRHLLDLANAEQLSAESLGVRLLADLAELLRELNLPAVAYIPPVNLEVVGKIWGEKAVEQVRHNAGMVTDALSRDVPPVLRVVNIVDGAPAADFSDPTHLNDRARLHLAASIARELRTVLAS